MDKASDGISPAEHRKSCNDCSTQIELILRREKCPYRLAFERAWQQQELLSPKSHPICDRFKEY